MEALATRDPSNRGSGSAHASSLEPAKRRPKSRSTPSMVIEPMVNQAHSRDWFGKER